jgi:hypothetical protein
MTRVRYRLQRGAALCRNEQCKVFKYPGGKGLG